MNIESLIAHHSYCVSKDKLAEKLKKNLPLQLKFGVDPTRPDLHFGHLVILQKLRLFQKEGHKVVLVVGDYTAQIGDPSGRSETRVMLSKEDVEKNAQTYLDQVFRVLDQEKTEVRRNSEWLSPLRFNDILQLASKVTVAQLLEREDFSQRYQGHHPIALIEFLYPLMQAYDSVVLKADVEFGGNDQLFNLLMGRVLQKAFGQEEQCVLCMPLITGTDGVKKMSKSYDNYIAFNDSPSEMFGKLMSIPDSSMKSYFHLLLGVEDQEWGDLEKIHPKELKQNLAFRLVEYFYGTETAQNELQFFEAVFSKKQLPQEMPQFIWEDLVQSMRKETLLELLWATKLFESKKAIQRLIEQNAVKKEGIVFSDANRAISIEKKCVFQVGKRMFFCILRAN